MRGPSLGTYQPGTTVLHRLPPGAKLAGLFAFAIAVIALPGPWYAVGALALAVGLAMWARVSRDSLLSALRGFAIVGISLGAYHVWQNGWSSAAAAVAAVFALIVASTVFTATTAVDDLLDTITRILTPLRPLRVDPEKVALAFALTLRAVPSTLDLATETADAARARGLERSPRARLIPLVLRAVAQARHTGEALTARGVGDD
ncbi:energy-coupling factor transporter transmembrane component T family protein [Gordonia jinhuaensis]|uniref:energy-coupling factor transporter transmembrane component T family protein n=1 Tax=Gordonia jinhuaensis TaxID=1517702 RepID=UPI00166516DE|nr:energy-coupling factor transporter transmembrane protein EcfT [Gordonia jinhuaensis]